MDQFLQIIRSVFIVHPIHPLIVHFPIALTGAALFFMLLALWRRNDFLEKVAFANISLASVSTLAAGLAGLLDNARFFGGQAPNHIVKIILAITLLLVSSLTAILRWRKPNLFHAGAGKVFYVAAYFIGFALASVLGYLGGGIVYGY
jgi:uncharacterized membrane protein